MNEKRAGPRHLLSLAALDDAALAGLLDRAEFHATARGRGEAPAPSLARRTVANLFFEPSTRTRVSFELAARALGATVVNLDAPSSSATKGEDLVDTVRTLAAMRIDAFVVRHADDGSHARIAQDLGARAAVINAGEGRSEHPTQALIDVLTVTRRLGSCDGRVIAIVGDIAHSRVARSAAAAFSRLGASVRVAGPAALLPEEPIPGAAVAASFDDALAGADAVMMLRVQRERIAAGAPDERAYHADWGLTPQRLARAAAGALVMHPGPFNRGVEIASGVADGAQSVILEQVALGVPVRMAALEWALPA